jgi:thiamine transport system substrate-binding protein
MNRHIRMPLAALAALALAGCTLAGENGSADDAPGDAGGTGTAGGEVVLVTHESFSLPDEVLATFTKETGYQVTVQAVGDAGTMTNQLVLTNDSPIGDAVFGIDNTFASRAVEEGVLASYTPAELSERAGDFALEGEGASYLTPVSFGDVCVNIDDTWFEAEGLEPPSALEDLTDPAYEGLFVTPGASSSSPGLAFLLATIGEFGEDGWQDYWRELMANGAKVVDGWTDAYTVDFTAGGADGDRPIVLSYASSPPFTIPEGGDEPTTSALLDTCFRQVEYAGVIEGADNPEGAQALVDWLLSDEVQAAIPDAMFVYPVSAEVELPELWAQWAQVAEDPIEVAPEEIEANREAWVREWADIATG